MDPTELTPGDLPHLKDEDLLELTREVIARRAADRRENQIQYYIPASESARLIHESNAKIIAAGGGNRSGKTVTALAEIVALATGVFPDSCRKEMQTKFRGPISVRVCIESLTTVLHPIILPKLQWWQWSGRDEPGGEKGHWGLVPRDCLLGGKWEKSWSEKLRTLTTICRDPERRERELGRSTIQVMSYDQDWSDYASGSFHIVMHDEPPPFMIWKENRARVLDVGGRLYLAMTWPDDPSIPVDWIFDDLYEPGRPGPNKNPDIDWIELYTTDNRNLDAAMIEAETAGWSDETRQVKLYGQPIRFANLVHPLFTDRTEDWCFACMRRTTAVDGRCGCGSEDVMRFSHVEPFDVSPIWPAVFLLDPHPRKPHMFLWAQIDPADDVLVAAEGEMEGNPADVRRHVDEIEESLGLHAALRLIDPNMGRSPSSAARRGVTWQEEFAEAGLSCDLADDSDVGRARINEFLRPDPSTLRPRLILHPRCRNAVLQMKRYSWDEYRHVQGRDQKQTPRDKYDDYPTLLKYLMNREPTFQALRRGEPVIRRHGTRRAAY